MSDDEILINKIRELVAADYTWDILMASSIPELTGELEKLAPLREFAMNLYFHVDHLNRQVSQVIGVKEYRARRGSPTSVKENITAIRETIGAMTPEQRGELQKMLKDIKLKGNL